jgi:hypothetical protein
MSVKRKIFTAVLALSAAGGALGVTVAPVVAQSAPAVAAAPGTWYHG